MKLSTSDHAILESACQRLENPSLAIRMSSALGMPVEAVTQQISKRAPNAVVDAVSQSTRKALDLVLRSSLKSISATQQAPARPRLHTAAAMTSGAVSGFFGIQTLMVELPLTTGIMFRSIADIARAEGESPQDPETLLQCMQVFAMGSGKSDDDDAAETSYYGVRVALSKAVTDALKYVATQGVGKTSAPAMVRLIAALASRFGIVVTQKAMAQAIPVIGAVGGGLVNAVFISHFQDMARGHFAIRRLERVYGPEAVQDAYRVLAVDMGLRVGPRNSLRI